MKINEIYIYIYIRVIIYMNSKESPCAQELQSPDATLQLKWKTEKPLDILIV